MQLSGLHGFEFSPTELAKLEGAAEGAMTTFGLLANLRSGEASALQLDSLVPEHAPFCPCGVWLATNYCS